MKTPRIANAIGQIDDDLVAGAAKCKTKNKKHWLKWGSLAACFAVLVIAGAAILPSLFRENVTPEGTLTTEATRRQIQGLFYPSQRICNCMAMGVSDCI